MGILDRWTKKKHQKQLADRGVVVSLASAPTLSESAVTEPASAAPATKVKANVNEMMLLRPLVTEKAARGEAHGLYTFMVTRAATKPGIAAAVNARFGIKPINVRISNIEGKAVRFGQRPGRRSDYKKALVQLPPGKTISVHEGV